jgi:carboxypeptidase C (cathepsin A)
MSKQVTKICILLLVASGLTSVEAVASLASQTPLPSDEPIVTQHQITIGGQVLKYTARAGFLSLRDEYNEVHARIFYVAYHLDNGATKAPRPLTFAWNGGPGSASSALHLGALGPFRVRGLDEYLTAPPPYELTENESTWLDVTDLVFVDPVGTGYSYATSPEFGKEFWSPKGDISSIAEFIRLFLSQYEYNPTTPIFLVGESYGTFRAAGVAEALSGKDINLAGVVLISSVLDMRLSLTDDAGTDARCVALIPSYTVAAFVHKKLPADLQSNLDVAIQKSQEWALSQYSVALLKGDRLSQADRERTAKELSRFTGLDGGFLVKQNLRVDLDDFAAELLRDKKQVVGRYDVRATASTTSSGGEYNPVLDPSLNTYGTGDLIVPYLRSQLNFKSNALYAGPFGGRWPPPTQHRGDWMSTRWDWGSAASPDADRSTALAHAMKENKAMRVLVISGLYDLATPFSDAENTFAHMGLEPETRTHANLVRYKAGHMVYLEAATRKQLKHDFAAFVQQALSSAKPGPSK